MVKRIIRVETTRQVTADSSGVNKLGNLILSHLYKSLAVSAYSILLYLDQGS